MSTLGWFLLICAGYWAVVWLWIAGTSPLASEAVAVTWKVVALILKVLGGLFVVLVFIGSAGSGSRRRQN